MKYTYFDKTFFIVENDSAFVSPYSTFLLENYPLNLNASSRVCDYGGGTGILGIVATVFCKNKIVTIERNPVAIDILKTNYQNNLDDSNRMDLYTNGNTCTEVFDTIICNPASLPDIADVNDFCNGGRLGMDMILEVLEFASRRLSLNGKLYMIVTSILPKSIAEDYMIYNKLNYRIYNRKIITFRAHYNNIKSWVDENKKDYNEMYYIERNNQCFEELLLWEVFRDGIK